MSTPGRNASVLLLCLVMTALAGPQPAVARHPRLEGKVKMVFDGDTILLETGEKVRYLGIDAPEVAHAGGGVSDCYGEEAGMANAQMVYREKVFLRYDRAQRDDHGRSLAYVFTSDGMCVNLELVRTGHAWVYRTVLGFAMLPEFIEAQREAIRNRRGLWGRCAVQPSEVYWGSRFTWVFHRADCPLVRTGPRQRKIRFSDRLEAFWQGFSPCRLCRP